MNPSPQNPDPYNVVSIGAGTAGLVTSAAIAGLGGRAALVEKNRMGGDCLNFGCVPSKGLIAASRRIQDVREFGKWGLPPGEPELDFQAVMESMREARARIEPHDSQERFESLGVEVFRASAGFSSPHRLKLSTGETLRSRHFVITAGSRARIPDIPGLRDAGYFTNETVFDQLNERPRSMIVIGGGPIGSELSQVFRRLGVDVHQLERGPRILPREDEDASACLMEQFAREGIHLHTETTATRLQRRDGRIHVEIESGDKSRKVIVGDAVLVAAGRIPNLENLNLSAAGIAHNERGIIVNEKLQTNVPHIWAAGDIAGGYQFTHTADFMARTIVGNILNPLPFLRSSFDASVVPWCTYTSPEVARVGLNENEARSRGIPFDLFRVEFDSVDRAITERETHGFIKVLTARGKDRILGATIVGPSAGDILHEIVLAMKAGIGLSTIAKTIHAYPTYAEAVRKVADAWNRTRLTPRSAGMLQWLFRRQLRRVGQ